MKPVQSFWHEVLILSNKTHIFLAGFFYSKYEKCWTCDRVFYENLERSLTYKNTCKSYESGNFILVKQLGEGKFKSVFKI